MTNNQTDTDFSEIVTVQAITEVVDTTKLFDKSYKEGKISPIDQFLTNANKINLLWISDSDITREMSTIAFLGYMSAVESYIRALIRGIIQVDIHSQKNSSSKEITFGAALHHSKELLPEALMDEFSFVHIDNIKETFKSLLDINLALNEQTVHEFNNICQLRHCCVHRFGKLGAKNAMKLGIDTHSSLFEKPLSLTVLDLTLIAQNLRSIVKQINNCTYREILKRTYPIPRNKNQKREFASAGIKSMWANDYSEDKVLFRQYYNLFSTKVDALKSPSASTMYRKFIKIRSAEYAKKANKD